MCGWPARYYHTPYFHQPHTRSRGRVWPSTHQPTNLPTYLPNDQRTYAHYIHVRDGVHTRRWWFFRPPASSPCRNEGKDNKQRWAVQRRRDRERPAQHRCRRAISAPLQTLPPGPRHPVFRSLALSGEPSGCLPSFETRAGSPNLTCSSIITPGRHRGRLLLLFFFGFPPSLLHTGGTAREGHYRTGTAVCLSATQESARFAADSSGRRAGGESARHTRASARRVTAVYSYLRRVPAKQSDRQTDGAARERTENDEARQPGLVVRRRGRPERETPASL